MSILFIFVGYSQGCKHRHLTHLLTEDAKIPWQYCQLIKFCFKYVALLLQNKESSKEMSWNKEMEFKELLQLLLKDYRSRLPRPELNIPHLLGWTKFPMKSCLVLARTGQPGVLDLQVQSIAYSFLLSSLRPEQRRVLAAVLCSNMKVVTAVSKLSCGFCKEIAAYVQVM